MTAASPTHPPPIQRLAPPVLFTIAMAAFIWWDENRDWKTLVTVGLWLITTALFAWQELHLRRGAPEPDA